MLIFHREVALILLTATDVLVRSAFGVQKHVIPFNLFTDPLTTQSSWISERPAEPLRRQFNLGNYKRSVITIKTFPRARLYRYDSSLGYLEGNPAQLVVGPEVQGP